MSTKNPKITVITPTYNRADFIAETIESVLSQDFKDFEYYILDDGSIDNTYEVVKPFLKDKRVKYLYHKNSGEAETANWGWSLTSGEYFTQVNSDDPILPDLFATMVELLDRRKDVVVAYPDFYFIDENGITIKSDKNTDWNFIDALSQYSCYAASAGTFIRKSAFKDWKIIKDMRFKHINDIHMYWRMALRGNFYHVPKFLATWRSHDGGISANRYQSIPEIEIWFKEYFSAINLPNDVKSCKPKTRQSIYSYFIYLLNNSDSNKKFKQMLIRKYSLLRFFYLIADKLHVNALKISRLFTYLNKNNTHDTPLVSIIIPVYNGSKYVAEAINSALAQTYNNIEVIVINDGSTDSTERIAKTYGNKIKYFSKKNGGVASALNYGIKKSNGSYISWLSHDDVYSENKIDKQMYYLYEHQLEDAILFSDFYIDDLINQTMDMVQLPKLDYASGDRKTEMLKLLFSSGLHGCTLLIPKKKFINIGMFDENLQTTQDYDLWFKFVNADCAFHHIAEPLITTKHHKLQDSLKKIDVHKIEVNKLYLNAALMFDEYFKELTSTNLQGFIDIFNRNKFYKISKIILKNRNERFKYKNLQVGDNDLIGNKFNGHDLHLYLRSKNIDSTHLVWNKESDDEHTFVLASDKEDRNNIRSFTEEIQSRYCLNGIMNPLFYDVLYNRLFLESDIVHLHLIQNGIVDLQLLPLMSRLKPLIWTVHDPWLLSGHCIQHFNCNKWKDGCGDCPLLNVPFPMISDNSALNSAVKRQAIRSSRITYIVASKYIENILKKSPTFCDAEIHRIPFGVNFEIYKPKNKNSCRKKLGIPENAFVISFRGDNSLKKGIDYIEYALDRIKSKKDIYILIVGWSELGKKNPNYQYKEYGWLKDDFLMSDIYNASDIFLMPSTVETFGMMAIEAMSCGIMPLVLDGTALPEVVNAPNCGTSVKRDKNDYAKKLQYFCNNESELTKHGKLCYEFAKKNYDKNVYLEKIMQLYEKTIEKHVIDEDALFILKQLIKHMEINETHKTSYASYYNTKSTSKSHLSPLRKNFILAFYKLDKIFPKQMRSKIKPYLIRTNLYRNLLKY